MYRSIFIPQTSMHYEADAIKEGRDEGLQDPWAQTAQRPGLKQLHEGNGSFKSGSVSARDSHHS